MKTHPNSSRLVTAGWDTARGGAMARIFARVRRVAATRLGADAHPPGAWEGYVAALMGVAAASLFIALINHFTHIGNISLVYLLAVLWLAARYGRGPAVFASVLAFLAYDFLFIPPYYLFTVDDPTEWLSLFALLATALVLGQLTAAVQRRAREAIESQRRTATLYALSELIAATTNHEQLLSALARRMLAVFAPMGVNAAALILPGEYGRPVTRAVASASPADARPLTLELAEYAAQASWGLEHGHTAGGVVRAHGPGSEAEQVCFFVPLHSGNATIGLAGIAGTPSLRRLAMMGAGAQSAHVDGAGELFDAFCKQIALALDRAALRQEAVHAEALRESDSLKDALLGSVTHDLRTPLASIEAAAGSLLEPDIAWSEAERREFAETIASSARRLNRLVTNLLDLSRLEAGVAVPDKRWYPIGDVIATVLDQLDLIGRTEGYAITVDVADDVPPLPLDHAQIEQVLTNLIENALKYSPQGSTIAIRARVLEPSGELEVRVADQGIGIPPHELGAIFTKFYRVRDVHLPWISGRPPTGTGLGLAICAAIIAAHGGRIWAESQPGQGATLIFTLPIPRERPEERLPDVPADSAEAADGTQPAAAASMGAST